ncbi:MAG: sulfatase-like hydrolase/transferase [Armatimonadia bacterium]|nr:sulfatase-like hydrolase/transferase [Armatimonadia bacterium]
MRGGSMHRRQFLATLAVGGVGLLAQGSHGHDRPPNIVYILADDMGYGDVSHLNESSQLHTPNLDRLARSGMTFTDAHAGSAVCTPTRYGVLTGRYCWRSRLAHGVLYGYDAPLIPSSRPTVASMLGDAGYHSACFGKWHLGLEWTAADGQVFEPGGDPWEVDYSQGVGGGPVELGFDEFFGISASLDMPPYVYIEGDQVTELPTTEKTWLRTGPAAESFEAIDVLPDITDRAVNYIGQRAADPSTPFFLYMPLNAPHTPILPTQEFQGASGTNAYGDFVLQVDHTVGRVMEALEEHGLTDDTLIIFTADNGCSPQANFEELAKLGHHPSYIYRGHKADIYEGGHRVPFLASWPGVIEPGSACHETICLTDLMRTAADMAGLELPADAGEDSESLLGAFRGQQDGPIHEAVIHHSIDGSFSIRQGRWKLELCPGSGGWSPPRPGSEAEKDLPPIQLYDVDSDPGETTNVQADHPDVVEHLRGVLSRIIDRGRSTPGPEQMNDREVRV